MSREALGIWRGSYEASVTGGRENRRAMLMVTRDDLAAFLFAWGWTTATRRTPREVGLLGTLAAYHPEKWNTG